jgi:hypothetical protein
MSSKLMKYFQSKQFSVAERMTAGKALRDKYQIRDGSSEILSKKDTRQTDR